jgi:FixJ family two-component response regulator
MGMRFRVSPEPLHCFVTKRHRCIILDIRLHGMSGFELERHLASIGPPIAGGICFGARGARCATGGGIRKRSHS